MSGARTGQAVAKDAERYVREIYIIVLGLGFALFVSEFVNAISNPHDMRLISLALSVAYFCSLYYFFTYDWIAYNSLIRRFPYVVTGDLSSMGRFYTDLFALLVKACLLFLATQTVDYYQILSVVALFAVWHVTMVVWYYFGIRDYSTIPLLWSTHVVMVGIYLVYCFLLVQALRYFPHLQTAAGIRIPVIVLCLIIVGHATWRKKYLLKRLVTT